MERTLLVDELANELRQYRHSDMASAALAEHILAIPRIHDAQAREATLIRVLRLSRDALADPVVGTYDQDDPEWYGKVHVAVEAIDEALATSDLAEGSAGS